MPELETPLEEEIEASVEETEPEVETEEPSEDEEIDPVAQLREELQSLKAAPPWLNEIKTEVGRIRSLEARLQRAEDPTARNELRTELEGRVAQSDALLAELLNSLDESVFTDPSVRQKVSAHLSEQQTKAQKAALRDELLQELKPQQQEQKSQVPQWYTPQVKAWEDLWTDEITDAGFDPDADFKDTWVKASSALRSGGSLKDATSLMREQMKTLREEQAAAEKRQKAKQSAGKAPNPTNGGEMGPLDMSRPSSDRIAHLRAIGAL